MKAKAASATVPRHALICKAKEGDCKQQGLGGCLAAHHRPASEVSGQQCDLCKNALGENCLTCAEGDLPGAAQCHLVRGGWCVHCGFGAAACSMRVSHFSVFV